MEMIDKIREVIAIPSVTGAVGEGGMPYGTEVNRALKYMLSLCGSLGFRTKNCDDRLGWAEIGSGDKMMGILCHLDVVPAGDGWDHEPFAADVEDGKIYGRGVMDDKGPAMAAVFAMKDILDSGRKLNMRVRIIFGCQEETGDWTDMEYYCDTEEIPSFGFTPDADFPAIYGEKGILMLELAMPAEKSGFAELEGGEAPNMVADWAKAVMVDGSVLTAEGKAAHGSTPEEGINAISRLMDEAAGKGAHFAEFYMQTIGFDLDGSHIGCKCSDEASGPLTFNSGRVEITGGMAVLKVDIRYPVTYNEAEILENIEKAIEPWGVTSKVITSMAPVYMDQHGPVITKLMEAYREVTGDETEAQVMGGGTYARAMSNIVAFGPVFPGRECTEHTKNEWIFADDLEKARKIYELAIAKLACAD